MPSKIGIIGGAGPMAGLLLAKRVISICQTVYGCKNDSDFPFLFLLSYPFSEMLLDSPSSEKSKILSQELDLSIECLLNSGVEAFAIACNTLHAFAQPNPRMIHLIEESKFWIEKNNLKNPLLLCTSTSRKKNLFSTFSNFTFPSLKGQQKLDSLIQSALEGKNQKTILQKLIENECKQQPKIDSVLLGCTELSWIQNLSPLQGFTIVDPIEIVANKLCQYSFKCQNQGGV